MRVYADTPIGDQVLPPQRIVNSRGRALWFLLWDSLTLGLVVLGACTLARLVWPAEMWIPTLATLCVWMFVDHMAGRVKERRERERDVHEVVLFFINALTFSLLAATVEFQIRHSPGSLYSPGDSSFLGSWLPWLFGGLLFALLRSSKSARLEG